MGDSSDAILDLKIHASQRLFYFTDTAETATPLT